MNTLHSRVDRLASAVEPRCRLARSLTSAFVAATLIAGPAVCQGEPPPNFLIVFIDDLGLDQLEVYDDLNQYDDTNYAYAATPTLTNLAQQGLRFEQARAYPLCSPSRACLQSGNYALRHGVTSIIPREPSDTIATIDFRPSGVPLAQMVENLAMGHRTSMFGKLHLHFDETVSPIESGGTYALEVLGFDTFEGIARNPNSGPTPFTDCALLDPTSPPEFQCGAMPPIQLNRDIQNIFNYFWIENASKRDILGTAALLNNPVNYLTEVQLDSVRDWLVANQKDPFFALWCPNDIHTPNAWPPEFNGTPATQRHQFSGLPNGPADDHKNTRGRAKLEYLDTAIGEVLAALTPAVRSRTYVIVMGDNGTSGNFMQAAMTPELKYPGTHPLNAMFPTDTVVTKPYDQTRMKGKAYEAGVRVPLIVTGPGVVQRSSTALVDVTDVYETVRQILFEYRGLNYNYPGGDSFSFADILNGSPDANHLRQFSHATLSLPNGRTGVALANPSQMLNPVRAPDTSFSGHGILTQEAYYLRRDPSGRIWKIVRRILDRGPGAAEGKIVDDEFYELVSDPLEECNLRLPGCPLPPGMTQIDVNRAYFQARVEYARLSV